jgi:biotin operon repressor
MEKEEILLEKLQTLTQKEVSLSSLCSNLEIEEYELLGLVRKLREDGINILTKKHDDDIYLYNLGEKENNKENETTFKTDKNREFKFVAISDTRIGSKSQQLSILNDIYQKASELGYNNVIHCGNITEGLYPTNHEYADSTFLDDSQIQVDYITKNYPKFENIKTYFITGTKD